MVQAIGAVSGISIDYDYQRIISELRRFGLSPTGNKHVDEGRLEQAKTELVSKLQKKETQESSQNIGVQVIDPVDESQYAIRAELEEQRTGAMNIAMLNRMYFGI